MTKEYGFGTVAQRKQMKADREEFERDHQYFEKEHGVKLCEKDMEPNPADIGKWVFLDGATKRNGVYRGTDEFGRIILLPWMGHEFHPFDFSDASRGMNRYFLVEDRAIKVKDPSMTSFEPQTKEYIDKIIQKSQKDYDRYLDHLRKEAELDPRLSRRWPTR